MSENKDIQVKSTSLGGLKKSIHKSILKDGEYHHLKNGIPSSFEGDLPFIQNAPSNLLCVDPPLSKCACTEEQSVFTLIGSQFIKEKDFHILFYANPNTNESEIGFFYGNDCKYESKLREKCLNFNVSYPIKCTYQYLGCELNIYFQDGFNRDRHINLDSLPYVKELDFGTGCYIDTDVFDCSIINVQNDLIPPVVKPINVIEAGALLTGVYQFAICYANINGDTQSSYYSKTNPLPIYADRFGSYENTEGSPGNVLTNKAITVVFSNLDIRYDYINLAVIKTVQGTPTYELVATLPIGSEDYIYTGREVTKLLSIDAIVGLYPDYYNSKTLTSANNYLLRANLSTQDEANYQPFANLIELEWVAIRRKADSFETTFKNPITSVNFKGYQRGEVYAFGIQFLLSNGRKTSVFHIPGRKANASDLVEYDRGNYPEEQRKNFYEFSTEPLCSTDNTEKLYQWQVYDTATVTRIQNENSLDPCSEEVVAWGDFAYWESSDTYPCNEPVWKDLIGQPIRHHKFPTNNTFHHHNQPYPIGTSPTAAYQNNDTYIYPMGVRLKTDLKSYITLAVSYGYLTQEEANLITGYEIVRGDRTGNKSVIAKGLIYNTRYYTEENPSTGSADQVGFPNYPFNDLRPDFYIRNNTDGMIEETKVYGFDAMSVLVGTTVPPGDPFWNNPFPVTFTIDTEILVTSGNFTVTYAQTSDNFYTMGFYFYIDGAQSTFSVSVGTEPLDPTDIRYYKNIFTFHSPDTSFKQPFLGSEFLTHSLEWGAEWGRFDKVEGHPLMKSGSRTDSTNMVNAFKAIGNYNNYVTVDQFSSNYRRRINDSGYLVGNNFVRLPLSNLKINNRFRESSVGLVLSDEITDPSIEDKSRYTVSEDDKCDCKVTVDTRPLLATEYKDGFEIDSECSENHHEISSYYASLKVKIPNQYGQIDTVKYVLTGSYHSVADAPKAIFGGDTFITRFSLKRKHAFFTVNFIGQTPVGLTYSKSRYVNIPTPRFHMDNEKGGKLGEYTIDCTTSNMDCTVENTLLPGVKCRKNRNGYMYLYSTGIVDFFVESDINTELRYSGSNAWETWYPKLKGVDTPWQWMEEVKVSINFDNTYWYNFDYSKQNTEQALFPQAVDFKPNSQCKNTHPRRIIYSKQQSQEASSDKWLVNLANDYFDGDIALGDIIDIQALDTYKVLVRYVNGSQVFNAYDGLQLTQTSVTVGTGGMFSQRPQTFGETDNGYAGSQSKFAIDTSQFGTFFADAKRGKVFLLSSGLEEISNSGMFDWFAENMKFKVLNQIPTATTDNPYTGIGYCSVFDNRFNIWFLTKRDFILKDINNIGKVITDDRGNIYYDGKLADLHDENIWENVGWTISYSPLYKSWQSFHSFIPNYYIPDVNIFHSGLKNSSIYSHWDKFSFQNYYGKQHPFEVTLTTAKEEIVSVLQSIEYNLKIQKYLNNNYQDIYENHNINFTKAIISTDNQSSGRLNLIKKDNANPYQSLQYPKVNPDSIDILYSKVEGHKYRVNQFSDLVLDKNNDVPIFLHSENGVDFTPNNIDYAKVNTLNTQPFRNEFFDITLINDENKDYKFILKILINKTLKSLR